jgi:hypothetical protein
MSHRSRRPSRTAHSRCRFGTVWTACTILPRMPAVGRVRVRVGLDRGREQRGRRRERRDIHNTAEALKHEIILLGPGSLCGFSISPFTNGGNHSSISSG